MEWTTFSGSYNPLKWNVNQIGQIQFELVQNYNIVKSIFCAQDLNFKVPNVTPSPVDSNVKLFQSFCRSIVCIELRFLLVKYLVNLKQVLHHSWINYGAPVTRWTLTWYSTPHVKQEKKKCNGNNGARTWDHPDTSGILYRMSHPITFKPRMPHSVFFSI